MDGSPVGCVVGVEGNEIDLLLDLSPEVDLHLGEWLAGQVQTLPRPLPALASTLAQVSSRTSSARLERGLRALRQSDVLTRFMEIYAVFTERQKLDLYRPELHDVTRVAPAGSVERLRRDVLARDPLDQMMYVDLRLWLPDDLLLVGDKMSMAESVEMRVPFLDPELVEFVESLPSSYKLRHGRRKAVEKAALEGLLPRRIVHRKERGFVTPVDRWLRSQMHGYARELLLGSDSYTMRLFRPAEVERLFARHAKREFDHTRQLFCLLSIELWARTFLRPPR